MFKMTKGDLVQKSDAQLAALFQRASRRLKPYGLGTAQAQSLITMIRNEIARRGPRQ